MADQFQNNIYVEFFGVFYKIANEGEKLNEYSIKAIQARVQKIIAEVGKDANGDETATLVLTAMKLAGELAKYEKSHVQSIENLKEKTKEDIRRLEKKSEQLKLPLLRVYFVFPDSANFYCQQYLLYFSQFLRDLGVLQRVFIYTDAPFTIIGIGYVEKKFPIELVLRLLDVYLQLPAILNEVKSQQTKVIRLEKVVKEYRTNIINLSKIFPDKNVTLKNLFRNSLRRYQIPQANSDFPDVTRTMKTFEELFGGTPRQSYDEIFELLEGWVRNP